MGDAGVTTAMREPAWSGRGNIISCSISETLDWYPFRPEVIGYALQFLVRHLH